MSQVERLLDIALRYEREMLRQWARTLFDELDREIMGGYQPTHGHLDTCNPPQGGSGVPKKE